MQRANHLIEQVIDPDNLRLAFWKASKGKRYAQSVLAYQADLDKNLTSLRQQIINAQVQVGDYRYFKVYEPKERQICASAFREQVLHHALMNICHPVFERAQIFDSYASRKGKGTYAALERAKAYNRQCPWFLKLDVRKFFEILHHEVIKCQLARLFKEEPLLRIFYAIIDSYEAHPDRGVPIGNLTSQYFANHYLSGLDHFIKEQLKIKAYARYMDDMVLWHSEKSVLQHALKEIEAYIATRLQCALKPPVLNRNRHGLPFLGYHLFPYHAHLLQKSKSRFLKKLKFAERQLQENAWSQACFAAHVRPLFAFTAHADTGAFRSAALTKFF
jgi:retron-type reverse transcriptase